MTIKRLIFSLINLIFAGALLAPAHAQISVSPVIVDLDSKELQRQDVEIVNSSSERAFVRVEPSRIDNPGEASEARMQASDPEELGLLASPPRLIVEPGQRRFMRVSALAPAGEKDRIFRVTVQPVVGELGSDQTGLKVLVGYDLLVIQRPATLDPRIEWTRKADGVTFTNTGNTNVQLIRGKSCSQDNPETCSEMPTHRLYAGNTITLPVQSGSSVEYVVNVGGRLTAVSLKGEKGVVP